MKLLLYSASKSFWHSDSEQDARTPGFLGLDPLPNSFRVAIYPHLALVFTGRQPLIKPT